MIISNELLLIYYFCYNKIIVLLSNMIPYESGNNMKFCFFFTALESQSSSGSKSSLLRIPVLLGTGYLLTVAQAAVGLWGVAFSLHLETVS